MAPELDDMSTAHLSEDMLDVGQSDIIDELDITELSIEEDIIELSMKDTQLSIIELDLQSPIIDELDIMEESIAEEELL